LDFEDLETGQRWQPEVRNYELIRQLSNSFYGCIAIRSFIDTVSCLFNGGRQHLAKAFFVFDK
jgi:CO dehydrogenase/acetyl-CoA synthase beta subunit